MFGIKKGKSNRGKRSHAVQFIVVKEEERPNFMQKKKGGKKRGSKPLDTAQRGGKKEGLLRGQIKYEKGKAG